MYFLLFLLEYIVLIFALDPIHYILMDFSFSLYLICYISMLKELKERVTRVMFAYN